MNIDEVINLANNVPGNFRDEDVIDYFHLSNVGHWPSEKGTLTMNVGEDSIILQIDENKVSSNYDLKPSAKLWLIGNFFQQFQPQVVEDMTILLDEEPNPVNIKKFHQHINQRMLNVSQIFKSGGRRYAFVERVRLNNDNSILLTYDIKDLDDEYKSWFAIVVPSLRPRAVLFTEFKNSIVQYSADIDGRVFEDCLPWERADMLKDFIVKDYTPASKNSLNGGFLLTEHDNQDIKSVITV